MICTIYKNIFSKEPYYITVKEALNRILRGHSGSQIAEIRETIDKGKSSRLKANLPSVCFSGKFGSERKDEQLIEHSGFIVLDFDDVADLRERQDEIINLDYVYACWVSPSGNGLKALIRIADTKKHREHFQALQDVFPDIDKSGINVSRVCYESSDPEIYINEAAKVFKKVKVYEKQTVLQNINVSDEHNFKNILKWLNNRNDAFVTGERNLYIFKLASACSRFGIEESTALSLINSQYAVSNDFTMSEMTAAIKSAYRSSRAKFGTAVFEREKLVDKVSTYEIDVKNEFKDESGNQYRVEDVVYGIDVKDKAININKNGFQQVKGIGIVELDYLFKPKRGEPTLLTGIGNYGKSAFKKFYMLCRMLLYKEKVATFSPEDTPAEEYFHDYVEMLLGCECNPNNPNRPSDAVYEAAYDFVSKFIFYIAAEMLSPTPEYIKEKFLELIIQEKIDFCIIDPFNQMTNNYQGFGGRTDKYLETLLSDFTRFYQKNDVYGWIIAHPTKMEKDKTGNYQCPDVFDINDGAMWNNKMYNILVYHRPFAQTDPKNPTADFYSKKIKKKSVGRKGFTSIEYNWETRRFIVNGVDVIQVMLDTLGIDFWAADKPNKDVVVDENGDVFNIF